MKRLDVLIKVATYRENTITSKRKLLDRILDGGASPEVTKQILQLDIDKKDYAPTLKLHKKMYDKEKKDLDLEGFGKAYAKKHRNKLVTKTDIMEYAPRKPLLFGKNRYKSELINFSKKVKKPNKLVAYTTPNDR